ncbi:hypothetical protein SAMN05216436_13133 [bacterium A37T11]|nr:hypothetical protein SAMN05216436_13133 [bacterium A37T11]
MAFAMRRVIYYDEETKITFNNEFLLLNAMMKRVSYAEFAARYHYPDSSEKEKKSINVAIQALIDLQYFRKERSPYQLLLRCQSLMYDDHIKLINIYHALTAFSKQKTYPKLKRVKSKYSGYEYVAIEKPE